jgi:gluconolactonase
LATALLCTLLVGCTPPAQPTQPPALASATPAALAATDAAPEAEPTASDTTAPEATEAATAAATDPAMAVSDFGDLFPAGAQVELLFDNVGFTEGPLWLPDGRLIFSRMSDDAVAVIEVDGALGEYLKPSGGANGHAFDWEGRVLQAEHSGRVTRLEADGTVTVLAETFEGKRLNSPNDLVVRSDGVIYFTDPTFGLNGRDNEIGFQGVFRLDPVTQEVRALIRDLPMPNGIGLSPDESTLYVSDTTLGQVFAYPLGAEDAVGAQQTLGPGIDGLLVDSAGRIWSSAPDGVHVLTADGQDLGVIALAQGATNVALGGPDGQRLFITTSTGVYAIDTLVTEAAPGH